MDATQDYPHLSQLQGLAAVMAPAHAFEATHLIQFAAVCTHQHVLGVSRVVGEQIARKQIDLMTARRTGQRLDPQKVFYEHIAVAVMHAVGSIDIADRARQIRNELVRCDTILFKIDVFDFLADNPGRHWIDVESHHVAADPVRLDKRTSAAMNGSATTLPSKS